jgi:hypothetical protein
MRSFLPVLSLVVASVTVSTASRAGVPSPSESVLDPCLVVCPAGEIVFHVLVRDINHSPLANSSVVIDFCGCPNVTLCPVSTTDPYTRPSACQIRMITDATGHADFAIRAGGGCTGSAVKIFADGILLAFRNVASPDQDGNLMVLHPDLDLAESKRGSADPTADFNCDGQVADADVDFVVPHGKHACPPVDPTPARRGTWGMLKTIYR